MFFKKENHCKRNTRTLWVIFSKGHWFNSSPPSATYMRQWTRSTLVQAMACHLFGVKPLPEPMLAYFQLDSWEQNSVKYEWELCNFHSGKCIWKYLPEWLPFCPGGDELTPLVLNPEYFGQTSQISWLLMPWILASPDHQEAWYLLCAISTTCIALFLRNANIS